MTAVAERSSLPGDWIPLSEEEQHRLRLDISRGLRERERCAVGECRYGVTPDWLDAGAMCLGWHWVPVRHGDELYFANRKCPRRQIAERRGRQETLLASSRLPALLRQKHFENFDETPTNRAGLFAARSAVESTHGLVLAGPAGTGKTHLAAAILNHRLAAGIPALFVTVPELMNDLRDAVRRDDGADVLKLLSGIELLVLDDLGAERQTDFASEQLFVVLNARLLACRQTVVTTNFTEPSGLVLHLGKVTGARLVSRLREMAEWVVLEGVDWRLQAARKRAKVRP